MNYITLPIIILSAVSIYLALYYVLAAVKMRQYNPRLVVAAVCFMYFLYNCARIGIYSTPDTYWNYLWVNTSLAIIPVIAIFIIVLLAHILNEGIRDHYDYLIFAVLYGIISAGIIVESIIFFPETRLYVIISKINNSPVFFNLNKGIMRYVMLVFLLASIVYFFIRLRFYIKNKKFDIQRVMMIIVCMSGLFLFVIHDVLVTMEVIPFYLFMGEYGLFFMITMVTSFSLNPGIFPDLAALAPSGRKMIRRNTGYTRSLLTDTDMNKIQKKLDAAMAGGELYADPDITLKSLAGELSISYHALSQFLNSVMGMDFRNYINQYRVEKAKRLIRTEPGSSIISICYNVGFQSKSAFNRAFKSITGFSPSEFREHETAKKA